MKPTAAQFQALFEPKGVIVAGASSHPGKFGFVTLHNILACGYRGPVFATNREGGSILGVETAKSIDDLPDDAADLVVVCTPAATNIDLLQACARKGVRAAFVTSAGYREAGAEGREAEIALVRTADELGIALAGPNGQGLVSTPANLCAQIVAPYPPSGGISIASQSGNFVSSFMNYAIQTGVGVARAISAGNAASISVAEYLNAFGDDPATNVALAYVEDAGAGRAFYENVRALAERKPVVVVKGGVTAGGRQAAASHTGALASEERVISGALRQAGACRATTIEEAFDVAATFATQPLPRGPNTVVVTSAGGWGVVTADAIGATNLTLLPLPDQLRTAIDRLLPPRWSRSNPIDMAGGETRDTIPEILGLVAAHPDVHSIVYLGLGIQANTARLQRRGPFYPDHGLERIVEFHERQDTRFAEAAVRASREHNKPVLVATELAVAIPDNPGPATIRANGQLCYPSSHRAVAALAHLWWYSQWRSRRAG